MCEASLVAQRVINLSAVWETWAHSLCQEDLLEKGMATHSSILACVYGQRSLACCNSWGRKESDTTDRLN